MGVDKARGQGQPGAIDDHNRLHITLAGDRNDLPVQNTHILHSRGRSASVKDFHVFNQHIQHISDASSIKEHAHLRRACTGAHEI